MCTFDPENKNFIFSDLIEMKFKKAMK